MAVPKKKTSKSKTRSRRNSAWKLSASTFNKCPQCGSTRRPHHVCGNCGWYNGREALEVT
ncbi:MAG: 50S ribosomal protein L32 [Acidimicrobiales bacterium]|nr:50S ribosomal protein L32 [Acidimicrobiales bacterium]MDG1846814.1 50S ribosomal protein L32 [Acidimicrobiales bacterium]